MMLLLTLLPLGRDPPRQQKTGHRNSGAEGVSSSAGCRPQHRRTTTQSVGRLAIVCLLTVVAAEANHRGDQLPTGSVHRLLMEHRVHTAPSLLPAAAGAAAECQLHSALGRGREEATCQRANTSSRA